MIGKTVPGNCQKYLESSISKRSITESNLKVRSGILAISQKKYYYVSFIIVSIFMDINLFEDIHVCVYSHTQVLPWARKRSGSMELVNGNNWTSWLACGPSLVEKKLIVL